MSAKTVLALVAAVALATPIAACAPVVNYNGFQSLETKPSDLKVGIDSRGTALSRLGSPSAVSTFDNSTWYYISQTTDKVAYNLPQISRRDITAITFDKEDKVASVKTLALKDGYQIAYEKRETPTRGRELSVLEQLLGNVGKGGTLPQENDPGRRPGSSGRN